MFVGGNARALRQSCKCIKRSRLNRDLCRKTKIGLFFSLTNGAFRARIHFAIIVNADVAQSVEQLIRNQQVAGSSPATSSTKPVKIERFSPVFSFICSDFRAANLSDPNRDPHGEMSKERRRGCLSYPLRRSVFFVAFFTSPASG